MNYKTILLASCVLVLLSLTYFSVGKVETVYAAGGLKAVPVPTPVASLTRAAFTGYKGILIGTPANDVRLKLGEPKEKSDVQDYYVISDGETAQILYDNDKLVKTISTSYFGPAMTPPSPKDMFGVDVEAAADGSINKIVKYPKAGYWISYIRTGGSEPMVMVTIHKIQRDEQ